jgi:hypothetical protein
MTDTYAHAHSDFWITVPIRLNFRAVFASQNKTNVLKELTIVHLMQFALIRQSRLSVLANPTLLITRQIRI